MAINYAEKYSDKVDERFKLTSITSSLVNNDYDWVGVKTIKIYSIDTVTPGDYTRSGSNRYGTPTELGDTLDEYTITQDKAFTFTIDKGNDQEQLGVKNAGKALAREIEEEIVPMIDKYRLGKIIAGAGLTGNATITTANAYDSLLDGIVALNEAKAPRAGRIIVAPNSFYKMIRLDDAFIKASDIAQNMLINGQMGTIEGMPLVLAPSDYFTEGVQFIITHPLATVAPMKLDEYKIHLDPPGISGALVEGRQIYDTFVLKNKAKAIYVCKKDAA